MPFNRKVRRACGLSESHLPSRRTFDRRLKIISIDIKERVTAMGRQFVSEGLVKPHILAIDSTLIKAKRGKVWHKSSMGKGILPCSGIDTDAGGVIAIRNDGYLDTNYIWCQALVVAVPLSADVTTANVQDNQVYGELTRSLPSTTIKETS